MIPRTSAPPAFLFLFLSESGGGPERMDLPVRGSYEFNLESAHNPL